MASHQDPRSLSGDATSTPARLWKHVSLTIEAASAATRPKITAAISASSSLPWSAKLVSFQSERFKLAAD